MNPDHFFIDALTIAGGFGAVALGILAVARAQEWRDARRKRRQEAEFKLAAAENVRLAAKTLTGGKDIHDRYLDPVGGFKGESLVGRRFEVAVPPAPTVDERLRMLETRLTGVGCNFVNADTELSKRIARLEQDSNSQKHVNRDACARADGIEAKLSKLTQASDALDHWIHKIEERTEKLHESMVSHARDIDRLDGRIDTLAKRRAPKKRAR